MSLLTGYGATGQSYDFYSYNATGQVWDAIGSAWVTWTDANWARYQITGAETGTSGGGSGRFTAASPNSSVTDYAMRLHGGSLAASPVVYEGSIDIGAALNSTSVNVVAWAGQTAQLDPNNLPLVSAAFLPNPVQAGYGGSPVLGATSGSQNIPAISGTQLQWFIDYPVTQNFDIVGYNTTGWQKFYFTVKTGQGVPDSQATMLVTATNPPDAGDGLVLLNGVAPIAPTAAADGVLTVTETSPNTTFSLVFSARGLNLPTGGYQWELTMYTANSPFDKFMVGRGTLTTNGVIRQNPVEG